MADFDFSENSDDDDLNDQKLIIDENKPLVFVQPFSNVMAEVYEDFEKNSEKEKIKLIDVDDISDAIEVLPKLGPFVLIGANAKIVAKIIKESNQIYKETSSKSIIISPKRLSPTANKKLRKLGISDLATEPIAARSLNYKIKMYLKTILSPKDFEEKKKKEEEKKQNALKAKQNADDPNLYNLNDDEDDIQVKKNLDDPNLYNLNDDDDDIQVKKNLDDPNLYNLNDDDEPQVKRNLDDPSLYESEENDNEVKRNLDDPSLYETEENDNEVKRNLDDPSLYETEENDNEVKQNLDDPSLYDEGPEKIKKENNQLDLDFGSSSSKKKKFDIDNSEDLYGRKSKDKNEEEEKLDLGIGSKSKDEEEELSEEKEKNHEEILSLEKNYANSDQTHSSKEKEDSNNIPDPLDFANEFFEKNQKNETEKSKEDLPDPLDFANDFFNKENDESLEQNREDQDSDENKELESLYEKETENLPLMDDLENESDDDISENKKADEINIDPMEGKNKPEHKEDDPYEGEGKTDHIDDLLDGEAKTDHLEDDPLEGEGKTDHIDDLLDGEAKTDHLEDDPLEGEGKTDHIDDLLDGEAKTDHLEDDPLEGEGKTDHIDDLLDGEAKTDHINHDDLEEEINKKNEADQEDFYDKNKENTDLDFEETDEKTTGETEDFLSKNESKDGDLGEDITKNKSSEELEIELDPQKELNLELSDKDHALESSIDDFNNKNKNKDEDLESPMEVAELKLPYLFETLENLKSNQDDEFIDQDSKNLNNDDYEEENGTPLEDEEVDDELQSQNLLELTEENEKLEAIELDSEWQEVLCEKDDIGIINEIQTIESFEENCFSSQNNKIHNFKNNLQQINAQNNTSFEVDNYKDYLYSKTSFTSMGQKLPFPSIKKMVLINKISHSKYKNEKNIESLVQKILFNEYQVALDIIQNNQLILESFHLSFTRNNHSLFLDWQCFYKKEIYPIENFHEPTILDKQFHKEFIYIYPFNIYPNHNVYFLLRMLHLPDAKTFEEIEHILSTLKGTLMKRKISA